MWIAERGPETDLVSLIDPNHTALVVIDVQNDFCHSDGAFGGVGHDNGCMPELASALHKLLAAARAKGLLIIFVRATYDREVTSVPLARHRRKLGLLNSLCLEGSWGADWFGDVVPQRAPNEVVVTKHRFDAFKGTELDLYLRTNHIRTVIVTGVVTSGCVESTVRDAFFLDYQIVVPRDGVAESNPEHHETALRVMARSFATISDVDEIVETWRRSNTLVEPSWIPTTRGERVHPSAPDALLLFDTGRMRSGSERDAVLRLLTAARRARVQVVHVHSVDREVAGSPWEHTEASGMTSSAAVEPGEWSVAKLRRSGFADSRLALLLRTNGLRHLLVAGADNPPGALAATVLDGLDADYAVTIARDAVEAPLAVDELGGAAGARIADVATVLSQWPAAAPTKQVGAPLRVAHE
jgi:ureidoacrylate peracid hydrolase